MIGSLQLGLIYGLLAIGVYIAFRILDIPDLTADGSFTLGMAVSAMITVSGRPFLGLLAAIAAGAVAGSVTGFLQTKAEIHPILAGILTMSGLYSINLFIMGASPNVSLIGKDNIFSLMTAANIDKELVKTVVSLVICLLVIFILIWFFKTNLGLSIRATGDNEDMVRASSINADMTKITALAIGNACVALSGAVIAQHQGFADINSGVGTVVIGLASVIIGEAIFGKRNVAIGLFSAASGSIIYRYIIALALKKSIFPAYALKLISALIIIAALSVPIVKRNFQLYKTRREAEKNV